MLIDHDGKLRSSKISQIVFQEKLVKAIIKHDLPFSFVEYKGVNDVFRYLNTEVKFISKNTIAKKVWNY